MSSAAPWSSPKDALSRDPGASSRVAAQRAARRYLFRIGSFGFLVPEGVLAEAIDQGVGEDEMAHVPFAPPWLLGLANVRGRAVPVFDLSALLPDQPSGYSGEIVGRADSFLMLGAGERQAIFLVDGLPQPAGSLEPSQDIASVPTILRSGMSGLWLSGADLLIEFDHHAFLMSIKDQPS